MSKSVFIKINFDSKYILFKPKGLHKNSKGCGLSPSVKVLSVLNEMAFEQTSSNVNKKSFRILQENLLKLK